MSDEDSYSSTIDIWTRWDDSFWTSFNMFLLTVSILLVGFATVYQYSKIVPVLISIIGIVSSYFWLRILNRKYIHIILAQKIGRRRELQLGNIGCFIYLELIREKLENHQDIKADIGVSNWHQRFARGRSGKYTAIYFPLAIIVFWIFLFIISILRYFFTLDSFILFIKNIIHIL